MEEEKPQSAYNSFLIYRYKYNTYTFRSDETPLFVVKGTKEEVKTLALELELDAKYENRMKEDEQLLVRAMQTFESVEHFKQIRQTLYEESLKRSMMRSASCSFIR